MKRKTIVVIAACLSLLVWFLVPPAVRADKASGISAYDSFQPYADPEEWGPYAVGIHKVVLVNENRWMVNDTMYRTLPTSIWYPAVTNTGIRNTIGQCLGRMPWWFLEALREVFGDEVFDLTQTPTNAFRFAAFDGSHEPYPVIVFSHGLGSMRVQSYEQCERLASHGFIVVSPDHPGNAMVTNTGEQLIFFNAGSIMTDVYDRPADVEFLYQELARINNDPNY